MLDLDGMNESGSETLRIPESGWEFSQKFWERLTVNATLHQSGSKIFGMKPCWKYKRKNGRQLPGTWTKGETPSQQIPQLLTPQVRPIFTGNPKLLINDSSVIHSFFKFSVAWVKTFLLSPLQIMIVYALTKTTKLILLDSLLQEILHIIWKWQSHVWPEANHRTTRGWEPDR